MTAVKLIFFSFFKTFSNVFFESYFRIQYLLLTKALSRNYNKLMNVFIEIDRGWQTNGEKNKELKLYTNLTYLYS